MKGKIDKRREHRVPLSDAAVALLRTQLSADPNPDPDAYVFPDGATPGCRRRRCSSS
jgi:hypothetical protein